MRLLTIIALLVAAPSFAAPFLIADVPSGSARADQCVYTRGAPVASPIVVDPVNGLPANGNRICKVDLASDPKTGTVTLQLRDTVQGDTGPPAMYTFAAALLAPGNLRLIP